MHRVMRTQKEMKAVAFAIVMMMVIADIDYAVGHEQPIVPSVAHSVQSQLETMDEQLWGAGTDLGTDLIQVQASGDLTNSKSQQDTLHLIEQDALKKAGFVRQDDMPAPPDMPASPLLKKYKIPAWVPTTQLQMPRPASVSPSDLQMQAQLATDQQKLLQMKMRAKQASLSADHEKAVRQVLEEGVGQRIQEQQRFYSYMSRWWRLHRDWMKRHNVRLYQKLREHRALSLSRLWKPFLLRWHYVQPRLLQGYRYNWNDDGTYEVRRFLMKSTRKAGKHVVAARIRSVNNICFPGLLSPDHKNKFCKYDKRVSARAAQFTLEKGKFQPPSLTVMRAYASYLPQSGAHVVEHLDKNKWTKANPAVTFVSVQGMQWQILEIIEYCDYPRSATGVSVPVPFSPAASPIREYSLRFMEWKEIKMGRELLDTGATVENTELKSKDEKLRITCVIPVDHPQNINGRKMGLTQQKCSIYIRQWDFNLKCPQGKVGALTLKTKAIARDDNGSGNGKPTMTPDFKHQLSFNNNKVSIQFEKQAVHHLHNSEDGTDSRSSVPVIMTQSEKTQWTSDPRFKTSRHVYFSFIVSDISQLKDGILNWDPELIAHFKDGIKVLTTSQRPESGLAASLESSTKGPSDESTEASTANEAATSTDLGNLLQVDTSAFMQLGAKSSDAAMSRSKTAFGVYALAFYAAFCLLVV